MPMIGSLNDLDDSDAPVCFECGSLMVSYGAIYKCLNCGATNTTHKNDEDDD